jgi:hypothetical protein
MFTFYWLMMFATLGQSALTTDARTADVIYSVYFLIPGVQKQNITDRVMHSKVERAYHLPHIPQTIHISCVLDFESASRDLWRNSRDTLDSGSITTGISHEKRPDAINCYGASSNFVWYVYLALWAAKMKDSTTIPVELPRPARMVESQKAHVVQ